MPSSITLHIALLVIALGALACLGWQAMAAVWGWVVTVGTPALVGLVLLVVVFVLLVVL